MLGDGVGSPRGEEDDSRYQLTTWSLMGAMFLVSHFPHFLQLQVISLGRTNWKSTARKTRIAEKQ